jgi:carbonic anhydrase/acetyltransferase-like protein (isoleucine patch superfamily)
MIGKYIKNKPKIHPSAFIAPGARLIGAVTIGAGSSVWYNSVLRADINKITIGRSVNIQDGCLLHLEDERGVRLEDNVDVGHGAILHACTIKRGALIGMGAIILNGAVIGEGSVVAAGALVPPGTKVPKGVLVMGVPAKVVRKLKPAEIKKNLFWAGKYRRLSALYKRRPK